MQPLKDRFDDGLDDLVEAAVAFRSAVLFGVRRALEVLQLVVRGLQVDADSGTAIERG